jgi:hypothetical protein
MSDCAYSPLKAALEKLTIPDIWRMLGLKGTPKPSCRSPLREDDRNASFSIYDGGRRWKDHGTGLGGDAADFCAAACNLSKAEGARKLIELAGTGHRVNGGDIPHGNLKVAQQNPSRQGEYDPLNDEEKTAKRERWPVFEAPTQAEIEAIARLRGLSTQGVTLAVEQRLLFCADSREGRVWVVTDSLHVNAQARRLDGKPWERFRGAKAWSLPGSAGPWPVGLYEARDYPAIALVEGAPDLLAAFHLIWLTAREGSIAPVALLGAGMGIPIIVMPLFARKAVKIFPHIGGGGQDAGRRWAAQLQRVGVEANGYSFDGLVLPDGAPVDDLNDFARLLPEEPSPERLEVYVVLLREAFTFGPAPRAREGTPVNQTEQ